MLRAVFVIALIGALAPAAHADSRYPWLGISIANDDGAVRIDTVFPDTPAERAGLRKGDLVLAIDDDATPTTEALQAAVRAHRVGEQITVHLIRDGSKKVSLAIMLEPHIDERDLARKQLLDRQAPGFSLRAMHGTASGSLAKLSGDVVVIEFWATWCDKCKTTFDDLAKLQRAEGKRGLTVLAISGEDRKVLASFLDDRGRGASLGFTVLHDRGKRVQADYAAQYLPTVIVIDRKGVVRAVAVGIHEVPHALRVASKLARDELP